MNIYILLGLLFLMSFFMAILSMGDHSIVSQIRTAIERQKVKGSIVFLNGEVRHYHSSSSSSKASGS